MDELDLTDCDREPIHIPGAVQPHGALVLVSRGEKTVLAVGGDVEGKFGFTDWAGRPVAELIGAGPVAVMDRAASSGPAGAYLGVVSGADGVDYDASVHLGPEGYLVELEPADALTASVGVTFGEFEAVAAAFERAGSTAELCAIAAEEFRRKTGYARVMIYRFLDDDSGIVLGEARDEGMRSFQNHRFPAADIPKQARALYLRNMVRVIPDVSYAPAPLRFAQPREAPLDLSDAALRSVSQIHLQYLKNMEVGASASVSIIKDGSLWGLVACHHPQPRMIGFDARAACRAIAGEFGRQLRSRDDTDAFRERVRLRSFQDDLVSLLSREGSMREAISNHVDDIRRALGGDGVAILRRDDLMRSGHCPGEGECRALAQWALKRGAQQVFATDQLSEHYPSAALFQSVGAGMLALVLSAGEPWIVMWFRAEEIEIIEWAGNPHKAPDEGPAGTLTPRASFDVWRETVRGRSRRWTPAEIEAATRLRTAVIEVWQARGLMELNQRLVATIKEKDMAIRQKEFLIGEVNHRVQNSLQLVSSFLALQGRASNQPGLAPALEEAGRRLTAVALVHRRLYRADQVQSVDVSRYVEELVADVTDSLGDGWKSCVKLDVDPILLPTDRAISLGLVLTELMINATKYAYGGAPGPIAISITEDRANIRLVFADKGIGAPTSSAKRGFGSRMMDALVRQIGGELAREDNRPGLRIVLTAPIAHAAEPDDELH